MKIVTSDQMRRIEERSEEVGVSTDALMERAGLEVARRVRHHLGPLLGVPVVVLVGPGNNGADGLVVARRLYRWGARAVAYLCRERPEPDPKLASLRGLGASVVPAWQDGGLVQLTELLARAHLVVDAVLGTGRNRPIDGPLKEILLKLSEAKAARRELPVMALDLPTGLDADTGAVDPACPRADVTVALGYPKVGHVAAPGTDAVGKLEIVEIGLPPGLDDDVGLELMTPTWAVGKLPHRPPSAHKGTFGRTLVVAGSRNYVGAAYLAATAATRVGAGLLTVAIPQSLQAVVAAKATEPTYLPLPESSYGVVSPDAASLVFDQLDGYDALLVGSGLGQDPATVEFVERLLLSGTPIPPVVVDADGLNILSMANDWWDRLPSGSILTPHPGEMARLAASSSLEAIQRDRIGVAVVSAEKWNKVTVLKGAHTVVAFPGGRAMVSPFVNPGLASAGTGDVLAGVIAGLVSQGLGLEDAAALGVYLHGMAGERVRERMGEAGMVAGDLLTALPPEMARLRGRA